MRWLRRLGVLGVVLALTAATAAVVLLARYPRVAELWRAGDARRLRERGGGPSAASAAARPGVLVVALDGVGRELLYRMLRDGELPGLRALLDGSGGRGDGDAGGFAHAHLDETLLAVLPSVTIAGWSAAFTGEPPAVNGVAGNEYFIRERARFVAPIPTSFQSPRPVLATYTDGYVNGLLEVPTLYEQLRRREPGIRIWVAMSQVYRGADRLLTADRTVLAGALEAQVQAALGMAGARALYEEIDEEVAGNLLDELERGPVPDVITAYFSGADQYAHAAAGGAYAAQREYLRAVLDPIFARLRARLAQRGALDDRYIVLVADHGHTDVRASRDRALAEHDGRGPAFDALTAAGFRMRPATLELDDSADYQAVLAYQGGMAFAYVADRSRCERPGRPCEWSRPPRYEHDVLPAAEAFYRSNATGTPAAGLRGALDLVLTRRPRPYAEQDLPFEVYLGGGRTTPVGEYLRAHPRPRYVALDARLRELAVGRYGERAGDVLVIPHNADRASIDARYYFARPHHSGHGGPGRLDAEVPLIVAHPGLRADRLRRVVRDALGPEPRLPRVTELILALRSDATPRAR